MLRYYTMETQNVSAQLYYKQLPMDPNSGIYCGTENELLSTCVSNVVSDANIERAFQEQVLLSEKYVFLSIQFPSSLYLYSNVNFVNTQILVKTKMILISPWIVLENH